MPATTPAATTPKPVPTKAVFIAQADEICRAGNAELAPFKRRSKALAGDSPAEIRELLPPILRQAVVVERAWIAKLQALPTPSGDATTIAKWLTALNEAMTDARSVADAVEAEGLAAQQPATSAGEKAKTLARGLAQGYGMKVCGKSE